jgi:Mce-associated membrane protein
MNRTKTMPEPDAVETEEHELAAPVAETTETDPRPGDEIELGDPAAETPETEAAAEHEAEATDPEQNDPAADAVEAEPEHPARSRPVWLRLPALLLAAAVLLAGAGVWFTLETRAAAANPAAGNLALTDVGATAEVTSAVTLAMNRVFSYSYDRTDVTEKAAAAVLRGSAKDSYDKLFAQVRAKAPQQKLVLTSRVSAIAVQDLRNGHARLLVFLDQSAVRADNNATDSAAAQLSVTAERTSEGWVVTGLEPR